MLPPVTSILTPGRRARRSRGRSGPTHRPRGGAEIPRSRRGRRSDVLLPDGHAGDAPRIEAAAQEDPSALALPGAPADARRDLLAQSPGELVARKVARAGIARRPSAAPSVRPPAGCNGRARVCSLRRTRCARRGGCRPPASARPPHDPAGGAAEEAEEHADLGGEAEPPGVLGEEERRRAERSRPRMPVRASRSQRRIVNSPRRRSRRPSPRRR